MACEGTLKMGAGTVGCQYVKWALAIFFSICVAKLHAAEKVLNQKGLLDFAPTVSLFEASFP
jgi:hypothetical protein